MPSKDSNANFDAAMTGNGPFFSTSFIGRKTWGQGLTFTVVFTPHKRLGDVDTRAAARGAFSWMPDLIIVSRPGNPFKNLGPPIA
jgi:hypothetical protein